jgi:hypothetical protein
LFQHIFSCIHFSKCIDNFNTLEQEITDSQIGHTAHAIQTTLAV